MNTFGQPIPVRDAKGEVTGFKPSVVSRVTKNELTGNYGPDKQRKLVVSFMDGDIIAMRPAGTRRTVSATALDLYAALLRWQANKVLLERARERKAAKQSRRESDRIRRADKRITNQARKDR